MTDAIQHRRRFLLAAAGTAGALLTTNAAHAANVTGAAGPARAGRGKPLAPPTRPTAPLPLLPVKQVRTDTLDIGYHEAGPADGRPVILLHGFPYDIHSYAEVAPMLAKRGYRVLVPYLRGHGSTRFLDDATPRTGQQAALGQDLIDFMDALHIPEAVLAGYDWGGRAACVMAALKPTRVVGLVAVNGYLIDDIAKAALPAPAKAEAGGWQQFYFLTERGRAGLAANRDDIARLLWEGNSPSWHFDGPTFLRTAQAFRNPDYVEVVIHAYRHRLGHADGLPDYAEQEARLAALPAIRVPTISMDGTDDGAAYAADGNASAAHFSGPHKHLRIPGAGHNLPQEAPQAFAAAVAELARAGRWRT
ncbi:pimeloyl-ACP methyl ester carboxylesterase [Duganella sp. SG902]|uniref:alpha/beta fold hydrolase n=1 Tax=Duganella sp. SG902 TaxID=2587016 RepID=UPI00159E372B|nr:alpha/beta hydrolase [Duganella sp. SG902]NVM75551.1 pimeloyl-ACP methyl ester carboxylesterase [Duganella sp. SG902]